MLTTIEAEIDVNASVTLLEPLHISKKHRARIILLDDETSGKPETRKAGKTSTAGEQSPVLEAERELRRRQLAGLKQIVKHTSGVNGVAHVQPRRARPALPHA